MWPNKAALCPPIGLRMLCQIKVIAHQRFARGPEKEPDTHNKYPKTIQKDPRTKHPGVFVCCFESDMKEAEIDNKQKRQMEFTARHTLSRDQFQKLIEAKFARAKEYHLALKQREMLSGHR